MRSDTRVAFVHNPYKKGSNQHLESFSQEHKGKYANFFVQVIEDNILQSKFTFDTEVNLKESHILEEFNLEAGGNAIWINDRIINLSSENLFGEDTVRLLIVHEKDVRLRGLEIKVRSSRPDAVGSEFADMVMNIASLVAAYGSDDNSAKRIPLGFLEEFAESPLFIKSGNKSTSTLVFTAVCDPFSPDGQKLVSILESIGKIPGTYVQLLAAPVRIQGDKLPLIRFYRFSFVTEPIFNTDGSIAITSISFQNLPVGPTYTLTMDVPDAWLVRPFKSLRDLDNIKLGSHDAEVKAEFQLTNILIQGHASETSNTPPRGMQWSLGTPTHRNMVDTITMANLGYFQLKADIGVWQLSIRNGRSAQVYGLKSITRNAESDIIIGGSALVTVSSFEGLILYPSVYKRSGMENEDIMQSSEYSSTIFQRVKWA